MKHKVQFQPNDVTVTVNQGANLLDVALAADVHIDAACGGQGACGKCRVKVKHGEIESDETQHLTEEDASQGWRLACQCTVVANCTIEIPVETRPPKGEVPQTVQMGDGERRVSDVTSIPKVEGWRHAPLALKKVVQLQEPTLKDNTSDFSRLSTGLRQQHSIDPIVATVPRIKTIPQILRKNQWKVTATLMADPMGLARSTDGEAVQAWHLVRLEGGDTTEHHVGMALDIGTTTVCGELIDLKTGNVIAEKALYNEQIAFGEDVISRIVFAQKPKGARKLQQAVVSTINQVIKGLLERAQCPQERIATCVAAGNTTMTHLLLGLETRYIREAPYVPAASGMLVTDTTEVGIESLGCIPLLTFPGVASYVGGDIVSGILGSGVFQREELTLYMDIGTNGEIVLGNRDWLACAACSMGPAFEGGGIQHGMRAQSGAIEGFHLNPRTLEPMVLTIGKTKPRGICGSGLISVLAELLTAGVIDPRGKFVRQDGSKRIREGRYGHEYVLVWKEHAAIDDDIVINEVDIDNLIRAKGALFAGCLTLLDSLSLSFQDVKTVMIAGAFGQYISLEKGQRIGLFPDIPVERFRFLGNGSLMGARVVSLGRELFRDVARIGAMMTNMELSDNPSFMDKYMAALFLPHTDSRLFPHVSNLLEQCNRHREQREERT